MMQQYVEMFAMNAMTMLSYLGSRFSTFGWVTMVVFLTLLLVMLKLEEPADIAKKIMRSRSAKKKREEIEAIAGDDMVTTQLDLARAYIEMNDKDLAKQVLSHAAKQGNVSQQQEAKQLLAEL